MTTNKYQRKLEILLKVRAIFPEATVCNLQKDVKDFFPSAMRLNHPEIGLVVVVGKGMIGQN